MNHGIGRSLLMAVAAIAITAPTNASVKSKTIIVEDPSDLPELAQVPTEAMYIHHTGEAQAILYLEQDQGRKLAIVDVTDPANIKAVGQVSINAPATYDFVQNLGGSAMALIRYRNSSEFAVISFKNYKEPILTPEPKCLHPASAQTYGPSDILLISDGSNGSAANTPNDPEYQVLTNSGATPLATIKNVIQRVDRTETGTIFLLTDKGVTVLRCLAAEREYQTEEWQKEGN